MPRRGKADCNKEIIGWNYLALDSAVVSPLHRFLEVFPRLCSQAFTTISTFTYKNNLLVLHCNTWIVWETRSKIGDIKLVVNLNGCAYRATRLVKIWPRNETANHHLRLYNTLIISQDELQEQLRDQIESLALKHWSNFQATQLFCNNMKAVDVLGGTTA